MSTSSADNKTIALRLIEEVLSKGNLSVADELLDVNFVLHLPGSSEPLRGVEGLTRAAEVFRSGFPDLRFLVEDVISEGDKVAVRAVQQGTHQGVFQGINPTAKLVNVTAIAIFRVIRFGRQARWTTSSNPYWPAFSPWWAKPWTRSAKRDDVL